MNKFEYTTHSISFEERGIFHKLKSFDENSLSILLNQYGKDGWELISSLDILENGWTKSTLLMFKRPLLKDETTEDYRTFILIFLSIIEKCCFSPFHPSYLRKETTKDIKVLENRGNNHV